MQLNKLISVLGLASALTACGRSHHDSSSNRKPADENSPAFKVGEMTHEVTKDAGKAAKAAGRELGKEAHEMREGWKEAQRNDKAKKDKERSR
jgi:type IV secretory pathway TrbL component